MDDLKQQFSLHPVLYTLTCLFVFVAIVARFLGLGDVSFIDDEYYLAKSVRNILDTGLPEFATGGYYTRGLIQQYLSAALLLLPLDLEFGMRLIPYICSALTIPAVYILANRCGGAIAACLAVMLFCCSIWITEFARFARMYAPFQMVFMWYLVYWVQAVVERDNRAMNKAIVIAFASIFVYAASLLLLAFSFLTVFLKPKLSLERWQVLAFIAVAVFAYSRFGVPVPELTTPSDLKSIHGAAAGLSAVLPSMLITLYWSNPLFLAAYACIAYFAYKACWSIWRQEYDVIAVPLVLSTAVIFFMLNLLTLGICLALIAVLLDADKRAGFKGVMNAYGKDLILLFIVAILIFSLIFVFNHEWYGQLVAIDINKYPSSTVQAVAILFNYPEIITRFVRPFLSATPITFSILYLFIAYGVLHCLNCSKTSAKTFRFLMSILILSTLFVGVTGLFQTTTRYSYFFYTLSIVLAASGAVNMFSLFEKKLSCSPAFCAALLMAVVIFLAEDFSLFHVYNMRHDDVVYRQTFERHEKDHYLPRRDFESPVEYVNTHREKGDIVISATTPSDIYLDLPLDYMYIPYTTNRFWERNVTNESVDVWSDATLIYRKAELIKFIKNSKSTVWLIVFQIGWDNKSDPFFRSMYSDMLVMQSRDATIDLFRISPENTKD